MDSHSSNYCTINEFQTERIIFTNNRYSSSFGGCKRELYFGCEIRLHQEVNKNIKTEKE